ncbi:hypothetical protein ACL02S_05735 [Nocardia sp. 004]|uniref:hypothetical protein n=1 Tax=Nocardia sp. 004 TaxID=3385978 RepID=UPI0039A2D048
MTLLVVGGMQVLMPMGMNKATPEIPFSKGRAPVKITGWTARDGYPDTVISGADELIVNASGVVTVHCHIELSGSVGFGEKRQFDLMLNDESKSSIESSANSIDLTSPPIALTAGDRLWISMIGSAYYSTTVKAGVDTYLSFDLA